MSRFLGRTLPLLLVAFAVVRFVDLGVSLVGLPNAALYRLYEDDTFYFLEIAWNWAHGLGSSFDGIHPTNGYQPLWQWLLVPVAALSENRAHFAAIFQVLVTMLHASAAVALFAVVRRHANAWAGAIAAWLLLFASGAALLSRGMESGLYAGLLVLSAGLWLARPGWRPERRVAAHGALGVVLGLTVLARLEAGLLVVLIGAALAVEVALRRERPAALVAFAAGSTLMVLPYLVANRAMFGAFMPVSVVMKAKHGHFRAELLVEWGERLFMRGGLPVALGIDRVLTPGREAWRALALTHALGLTAACVAAIVVALRRGAIAAAVLPAYLVLHELIVGSGCAAQWPVHWHFVPESVAMAVGGGLALGVAVPAALRWVRPSTRRITLMAATPMVLALAAMHVVGVLGPVAWSHWLMPSNTDAAARWIEANLPADAKLASFDSGYFGWVLDRPVVNLDGVANTLEYLEDFHLQKRHAAYLEREGITHVVNLITPEEEGQDHFRWVPRSVLVETHAFRAAPGAPVLLFEVAPQR